jgi:hypothetical protein
MTEQEIINNAFNLSLKINKDYLLKKKDIVGVHDLYEDSVKMAKAIANHSEKGKFPSELFEHRSPNQTEKEAEYIKNNFKQQTLPVFIDYISTITRPFGDGNWSIKYNEDSAENKQLDQTFKTYVEGEIPIYGSLENFIKFILPKIKTQDANGFLGIRPRYIDYIEDTTGELMVDDTTLFKPTILYYKSKQVMDFTDEYILFLSEEHSRVTYAGRLVEEGSIFELYTKEAVYFIKQKGQKVDNQFDVQMFYKHDLGYIPCHQLMGIPKIEDDKILWQSPFLYSVDLLDLALVNSNWLQASINKCVFPNVIMFGSPCDFRDSDGNSCTDGTMSIEGIAKTCPSCHGTGLKSRLSPLGAMLINPSTKFEAGEVNATQDPLRFVSPDVTTLEFLKTKIEEDTNKAREILKLHNTNSQAKSNENTTATSMVIDAKAMYSFIKPISDQIFTIYEFCLKTIGKERYGDKFVAPELSYPKTFDFKSAEDYLQDISDAIKNNLPPSFIQTILLQYINAFYGDGADTTRIFKLIAEVDSLFGFSQDEINTKLSRNVVAKWQDVLHGSILMFINEAIQDDANFLNKTIAEQKIILEGKAKSIASSLESSTVNQLLNDITP